MECYSTKDSQHRVPFREAVLRGLAPEKGLYMPAHLPRLPETFWEAFAEMSFPELAFEVCRHLLRGAIDEGALRNITTGAINFEAPLVQLDENVQVLELFHGPTLAFKDFGARFMARLMGHFMEGEERKLTILVATSGDTGGAVASGFWKTPGVEVIILYPSGKVSPLQEKQLTTLGENVEAVEVQGTFDDCQDLVKAAFLDEELNEKYLLSSANSINLARLIPQMLYYFRAYQQLLPADKKVVFCVPSGNFGNLTAGLIAFEMGLPVAKFVAATNVNNVVPQYLETGNFEPRPSAATISNAMDVGNPSNFDRMLELYDHDWGQLRERIAGFYFDDSETQGCIRQVFQTHGYVLDPHTAIGYLAIKAFQERMRDTIGVVLATAHPAKFAHVVEPVIGEAVPIPERLAVLAEREKKAVLLPAGFTAFKRWILERK
ncbi:MAG: threonine synthase [Bacteroidota bacterium]